MSPRGPATPSEGHSELTGRSRPEREEGSNTARGHLRTRDSGTAAGKESGSGTWRRGQDRRCVSPELCGKTWDQEAPPWPGFLLGWSCWREQRRVAVLFFLWEQRTPSHPSSCRTSLPPSRAQVTTGTWAGPAMPVLDRAPGGRPQKPAPTEQPKRGFPACRTHKAGVAPTHPPHSEC